MKYYYIFILSFTLTSCPVYDPPGGGLNFQNRTTETIYVYITCEDSLSVNNPMRLYYERGNEYDAEGNSLKGQRFYLNNRIEAGSLGFLDVAGTPNKPRVNCDKQSFYLFTITESVMEKYTWEEIVAAQQYQRRMQFTQQQLDSMKWIIRYFP